MVIGTCGFVASGSSAVSDYIKEFSSVSALDMVEFIITHGPDGLEDLDYQLNHHCVKYTSSGVAIERFKSNVYNYLVRNIGRDDAKKKIINALEGYVDSITQVVWEGAGAIDSQLYGSVQYKNPGINMLFRRIGRRMLTYSNKLHIKWPFLFPMHQIRFSICPNDFYSLTQQFICDVFAICNLDNKKKILLDQPFNAINPRVSFKFFNDPKAIIVDRDPRDQYLLIKCFLQPMNRVLCVPTKSVYDFIEYYRKMHEQMYKNLDQDSSDVLLIKFEDLVYKYEETRKRINEFCELDDADRINHYFDPSMSIANTQLIKRYPDEQRNIDIITRELSEYLYDFSVFGNVDTSGKMFPNRSPLNK